MNPPTSTDIPQPIRGSAGATDAGPRNLARDRQNPDMFTSPATDKGTLPNLKFSFSDAHNRLENGGWAREVTQRELPIATTLAGVNMRLKPGGVRELHWHKQAEWAYMLSGSARITAVDPEGRNFIDDISVGQGWNFPAGIPHSIQGLEHGCEFLLVFDDGSFSENDTFLLTDWLAHTARDVIQSNFGLEAGDLVLLPSEELYIFQAPAPPPLKTQAVSSPQGEVLQSFSHHLIDQEPLRSSGGSVRIIDSRTFPVASTIAAALVEVEPGAMRELHWHPTTDEWQYYLEGQARMTVFASGSKARTFNYSAGDVGYVPFAMGHYIQNISEHPLRFLEMFKSSRFADMSLNQWLALTPYDLVKDHLHLSDQAMSKLNKKKEPVVRRV